MKLLIFDIDGTLTHLDGATRRAFNVAFLKVFRTQAVTSQLRLHGRTDPVIFQDCYRTTGLTGDWEESFARFREAYVEALPAAIAATEKAHLMPGVQELLDRLTSLPDQVALALGTGNMEKGARIKIGHFGLNKYFPVGGFGDRHSERWLIMQDAVRAAEKYYRFEFTREAVWIIGDTPHDVAGGKAIGAHTLGVATGGAYSRQELVDAKADVVLDDLSDTETVLKVFDLGRDAETALSN